MKKITALFIAIMTIFSFAACEKKQIIGYEPEISQEWIEEMEKYENTEVVVTTEFDGIWQNERTGKYYHFYNGHLFELDKVDAGADEYSLWGTVVVFHPTQKELEEKVFSVHYNLRDIQTADGTTTLIDEDRTKTVTVDGKERIFRFVQDVYDWPEGYSY